MTRMYKSLVSAPNGLWYYNIVKFKTLIFILAYSMKLDKGTPSNLIKDIMKNISTKNDAFVRLVTIILLILLTIR